MYIGNPNLFIGGDWFIGSFAFPPTDNILADGQADGAANLFIFRNTQNQLLTALDFGSGDPNDVLSTTLRIQYRGYNPIKVLGFYLAPTGSQLYRGTSSPNLDYYRIIKWADDYTGSLVPPGTPGLEATQVDSTTEIEITRQFKSGQGDQAQTPVPYIATADGRLDRDQVFELKLTLNLPDDISRQIRSSIKADFSLFISYVELPLALRNIAGDEC